MSYKRYKYIAIAAALFMGISLTACGADSSNVTSTEEAAVSEVGGEASSDEAEVSETNDSDDEKAADTEEETTTEADKESEADSSTGNEADSDGDFVTMYTTESITLHKEASGSSEDMGVIAIGSEVQAGEVSGDYIKVTFDGKEGYVLKEYVTDDKGTADKAVADSKEAAKKTTTKSDDKKSSGKSSKDKKKSTECLDNGLLN